MLARACTHGTLPMHAHKTLQGSETVQLDPRQQGFQDVCQNYAIYNPFARNLLFTRLFQKTKKYNEFGDPGIMYTCYVCMYIYIYVCVCV